MEIAIKQSSDKYILQFKTEDTSQNLIESNIKPLLEYCKDFLSAHMEQAKELEAMIGNLGTVLLSDAINMIAPAILHILKTIQPANVYFKIFATLFDEGEDEKASEFSSLIPNTKADNAYQDLIATTTIALVSLAKQADDDTTMKAEYEKQLAEIKEGITDMNSSMKLFYQHMN